MRWVLMLGLIISADIHADVVVVSGQRALAVHGASEVSPTLFRGPRPSAEDLQTLANAGIRVIVNLQGGDLLSPRWWGWLGKFVRYTEPGELQSVRDLERLQAAVYHMSVINFPLDSLDPVDAAESRRIHQVLHFLRARWTLTFSKKLKSYNTNDALPIHRRASS